MKICKRCGEGKPATEEFWYKARPRKGHKEGWQSNCKICWKEVNKENKARIRRKL